MPHWRGLRHHTDKWPAILPPDKYKKFQQKTRTMNYSPQFKHLRAHSIIILIFILFYLPDGMSGCSGVGGEWMKPRFQRLNTVIKQPDSPPHTTTSPCSNNKRFSGYFVSGRQIEKSRVSPEKQKQRRAQIRFVFILMQRQFRARR